MIRIAITDACHAISSTMQRTRLYGRVHASRGYEWGAGRVII
jgi:hypothetical protein